MSKQLSLIELPEIYGEDREISLGMLPVLFEGTPHPDQNFINNIRTFGLLQPIIVTENESGEYVVEAGRRRILAA